MATASKQYSVAKQLQAAALRDHFIPQSVSPFKFVISFNCDKECLLIGPYDKIDRYLSGQIIPNEENTDIEGLLTDFLEKGIHATAKQITKGFKSGECIYQYNNISVFNVREFQVGHFILSFEYDKNKQWEHAINQFYYALSGEENYLESKKAIEFLKERFKTYDLVCQYAVVSMLRYYFCALTLPASKRANSYKQQMTLLARAFWTSRGIPELGPINRNNNILRLPSKIYPEEHTAQTWFSPFSESECIVLERSFFPLKIYCKNHLNKLGLSLQQCKHCGRYFFAKTMKTELCSDECKKARRKKADQKYYANELQRINKNTHQSWRNLINKVRQTSNFSVDLSNKLVSAYNAYKERAEKKHKEVMDHYLSSSQLDRYSQEELLKRMETEYRQWNDRELEVAKGILGEFEARLPHRPR